MQLKRQCKICGEEFIAIKHTQYFCKRKCFKKDYYQRTKAKLAEIESRTPMFNCPLCSNPSKMPFDPIRQEDLFNGFICPFCGVPKAVMFKEDANPRFVYGNSFTVQFVISSAIVSFAN